MSGLTYTLLGDGSSDRTLMHPIEWALRTKINVRIEGATWADFSFQREKPSTLNERVRAAIKFYPCDLLFVHRDAEGFPADERGDEIDRVFERMTQRFVPVVPVRMTEAWFLHSERAIREASGNPHGTQPLDLPATDRLESVADPKEVMQRALLAASEMRGRRLAKEKARFGKARIRVAELIDDFAPLESLPAFRVFLSRLSAAICTIR